MNNLIHFQDICAIAAMSATTYLTRILGYLLLKNKKFSKDMLTFMEILPGCVLISIIVPFFSTGKLSDIIGLTVTIFCAMRMALLPTILIAVTFTGLLRFYLG